jgi:hypothetical protein
VDGGSAGRKASTAQIQNEHTQTSMPVVRLEPTTSVFEWPNAVYALDRSATEIIVYYIALLYIGLSIMVFLNFK